MRKKVLIIDGDKQLIPILKEAFHKIQFEVFVESDRERAVEFAQENRPDLVIASVELPAGQAEGYVVCKDFKSAAELKNIPFLLTSRNAKEEDFNKHRKLKIRADDYLKKPFTDEELFQRVENLLGFEISKQDYNQLEEKMHTYLEQQTKLEDELKERDEEIRKLREQLSQAGKAKPDNIKATDNEEIADLRRELELKNAEIAAAHNKAEAAKAKANKQILDLEQKLSDLEKELSSKDKAIEKSKAEIEKLKEQLDDERAAAEEKMRDLEQQLKQLKVEMGQKVGKTEGVISSLKEGYEERLRDLEALLDGYKSKNKDLQLKISQQDKKISDLYERESELKEQIAGFELERQEFADKLKEAQDQIDDLEELRSGYADERAGLESKIEDLSNELKKLERIKIEWDEREEEHKDEMLRLQNELDAAMYEIKELEKDLKNQHKQYQKFRIAAQKLVDMLPANDDEASDDNYAAAHSDKLPHSKTKAAVVDDETE